MSKKVVILMGSDSDAPVKGAIQTLKDFGLSVEVHVISAHRTPKSDVIFQPMLLKMDLE